jgi:hypothetical protein
MGRSQWEAYERSEKLTLTVVVSDDDRHGVGAGKCKRDDAGQLVAGTVTLGSRTVEG